jgi:hypothetical protein
MRSRHGAVSGKRGKEKDEPAVCGEGSGDGDKRVKGVLFCQEKGGSGGFSLVLAGCSKAAEGGVALILEIERQTAGRDYREREDDRKIG